jgi:hypothetical protein
MRLWTILGQPAWEVLNERGSLVCDDETLGDQEFLPAYRWMMSQMQDRIGPPPPGAQLPLWAWQRYDGRRLKPIARRDWAPRGVKLWRVEFHVPDEQVLLSDFILWHFVLNGSFLPNTRGEHDAYFAEFDPDGGLGFQPTKDWLARKDAVIEASWSGIFDLDWYRPYVNSPPHQQRIQACFWRLDQHQIRRVDTCISRGFRRP